MPLNKKGNKILSKMTQHYGAKKGKSVFYAMENEGKLKGITGKDRKKKKQMKKPGKKKK